MWAYAVGQRGEKLPINTIDGFYHCLIPVYIYEVDNWPGPGSELTKTETDLLGV